MKKKTIKSRLSRIGRSWLCAAVAATGMACAHAQYPERPVRIVVPLSAGGVTDIVARLVGEQLSKRLGKPFIVENRPGAGGAIGAEYVANAKPDGYTLVMGTVSSHAINPSVYKSLRYNNITDFAPISLVAAGPNLLVVNPSVPVHTVTELINWIKAHPGKVSYGSTGTGTSTHLAAELFKQMTGVKMTHIPYKGSAPMMTDLVAGQVQLAFDNMPTALAQAKVGKLRAIAVTSPQRWPLEPKIPTVGETLPGFQIVSWQGLFAPAKTPAPIVQKLSETVREILKEPQVVTRFRQLGTNPGGDTSAQFAAFVRSETQKWARVAKAAGIVPQ
jgi:tripartite-type tricarboxylate transporter receptor subunit TctC